MSDKIIHSEEITGTGASIDVTIGYVPGYVKVHNRTSNTFLEWQSSMDAGSAYQYHTSTGEVYISSKGITPTTSNDNFIGIKIGPNTIVNKDDEILDVLGIRQ